MPDAAISGGLRARALGAEPRNEPRRLRGEPVAETGAPRCPIRPGDAQVRLDVSAAFASNATKGRGIVVATHAGKLGWEWVDTFRLTAQPNAKP